MKRLVAVAVVVALSASPVFAQRGGSHGGFSGSHGGFSGSHGGFSGSPSGGGFSGFHSGSGGFSRGGFTGYRGSGPGRFSAPPSSRYGGPPARFAGPPVRFAGPPSARYAPGRPVGPSNYVSNRMPYRGPGLKSLAPSNAAARIPSAGSMHRMPYDGRHGGNNWNHGGGGWNHGGGWGHYHNHVVYYGFYGWGGYPYLYWPWWGWGYPYLYNWNSWDGNDSQAGNYSTQPYTQSYPDYDPRPYEAPPDQNEPQPSSPQPDSYPAPASAPSQPPTPAAPVTLVFKDGRPNEQIRNYLLTPTTLSVLDTHRRDIPVDQIDILATERLNRESGVAFSLPVAQ